MDSTDNNDDIGNDRVGNYSGSPKSVRMLAWALVTLAVMVGILTATFVWSTFKSTSNHSAVIKAITNNKVELCSAQNAGLTVITQILTAAQIATDTDPTTSAAKRVASDQFVAAQFKTIDKARC